MKIRLISLISIVVALIVQFMSDQPLTRFTRIDDLVNQPEDVSASEYVKVVRVIDGDTVELEGGMRVRYIGIDTPEVAGAKAGGCFAREAKAKNEEFVLGKSVRLVRDVSDTDRYGRKLRYVYSGSLFVNRELVALGFAQIATFPPDVKYSFEFMSAQQEARREQRGLWGLCPVADWRFWSLRYYYG